MSCNCNKCGKVITLIMLICILVLNLILLFQKDAWDLETLKVWWKENMAAIQEIYKTEGNNTEVIEGNSEFANPEPMIQVPINKRKIQTTTVLNNITNDYANADSDGKGITTMTSKQ